MSEHQPEPEKTQSADGERAAISAEQTAAEEQESIPDVSPQIWVGSLSDYNNGILHGDWIDAAQDSDELHAAIQAVLATSEWTKRSGEPAEEWGIFDYEGFGGLRLSEYADLSWVSAVARGIAEHGPAFAAWADVMEDEDALAGFSDAYLGHYDSLEDYATQLVEDLGYADLLDEVIPESIRSYVHFDVAALGRDLALGDDVHALPASDRPGGGVWLFDARQ